MRSMMDIEPIPIVGTGRSGTGHIAALLTAAGVPCGHEQYWHVGPVPRGDTGLHYDASWLALRDVERIRREHKPVVHLKRDPLDSFHSFATKQWRNDMECPYYRHKTALYDMPQWQHTGHRVHDAAVTVLQLGKLAQRFRTDSFRLENLSVDDLCQMGAERSAAENAMWRTHTTTNNHGARHDKRQIGELLETLPAALRYGLLNMRSDWGYQ
jgi:hypothetical protein